MKTVYQSDLVDLKVVETESNGEVFYQVWKDGVVCKQSASYDHCKAYAFDLINGMVEAKLQALESAMYWSGQAYLHCTADYSYQCANDYTEAQKALNEFKSMLNLVE